MRLSAVNGIKKSEGGDWKIDLHRNKMIEFRGWSVLVGLRRTARDIATARISSEGLSMRTNARPGKVGARHASKPRTERMPEVRAEGYTRLPRSLRATTYLPTSLLSSLGPPPFAISPPLYGSPIFFLLFSPSSPSFLLRPVVV